jgi:hypothetical protein
MVVSYAEPSDVADRWRPLTDEEERRARTLLMDASLRVRRRFPRIDDRITLGDLDPMEIAAVVAGMVKRAMISTGYEGVTQSTQAAGPFQSSQSFTNPNGNLYFTADDLAVLSDGGQRRAFTVDLTPPLV